MTEDRPQGPEAPEPAPPSPGLGPPPPQPESALPPPPAYQARVAFERGRPIPIREMRVGELLDSAIKILRLHWRTYFGIAAYIMVPLIFIESFLTREDLGALSDVFSGTVPSDERSTTAIVANVASVLLQLFFIRPFLTGAFAKATSELYVGGIPDIRETYRFALGKVRSILWVSILVVLATIGGTILLIIPGIIFYFRFVFSSIIVVTEDLRGTDALRRSWRLSKKFFWKTFGTLFVAQLLTSIIGGILTIPFAIVSGIIGPAGWPLMAIGNALGQIVTLPFLTTIVVLLYFDLRIRKEGLDLTMMVEDIGSTER